MQLYSVHFAGSLDVQNILSAGTGISRKTEGHSFCDHLSSESVRVIECDGSFYCALFRVVMTRVGQCPNSLLAEHPLYRPGLG
jgi:hypothetical protein